MPGETDVINAPDVAELLSAAASGSPEVITADLTATVFCDSAGVEVLARASDMAAARGVEFRLALGGSPVARILQLTGLDEVMPLYRDVPHSLATPPARPGRPPGPYGQARVPQASSSGRETGWCTPPRIITVVPGRAGAMLTSSVTWLITDRPRPPGPAPAGGLGIAELPAALVSHLDEHAPGAVQAALDNDLARGPGWACRARQR